MTTRIDFETPCYVMLVEKHHQDVTNESRHADVAAVTFLDSGGIILHYAKSGQVSASDFIYALPAGGWERFMVDTDDEGYV